MASILCLLKIVEYNATHPIFELYEGAERMPRYSHRLMWWDQEHSVEGCNRANERVGVEE